MLSLSEDEIADRLDKFNWDFAVGANIKHNLEEIFFLYKLREESCESTKETRFLNKHISISIISILEVVLYDFVIRLSQATRHFPTTISSGTKRDIKEYISNQNVKDDRDGFTPLRVKNYSFLEIIKFLEEFELLGSRRSNIYRLLEKVVKFRNRIHIFNWYGNFERLESRVFTDERLGKLEKLFERVMDIFEDRYTRPWT